MQCLVKRSLMPVLLGRTLGAASAWTKNDAISRNCLKISAFNGFKEGRFVHTTFRLLNNTNKEDEVSRPESMDRQGRQKKFDGSGKGPVSWVNLAMTSVILAILYGAYLYAKNKKEHQLEKERKVELGKAKIGGTFDLIDHEGNRKTSEDFHGKWVMLYFGFTHCPDICPDEMEKMAEAVDIVTKGLKKMNKENVEILPLFITVDPERDGVKEVKEYIKEFHPRMIGLTGSSEKIKEACKAYRVYFSAGPRDDDEDYIVDHTIIIYLIDPEGNFVDYYGQTKTATVISDNILVAMVKYYQSHKKSLFSFT